MTRTYVNLLAACLFALALVACGGNEGAGSTTEPTETASGETPPPTSEGEPSAAAEAPAAEGCGAATDCGACIAIEGCNWTAGDCARSCAMDTYCIGPGNRSAMECTPSVTLLGQWQEDMSAREGDVLVFVSGAEDLGPARFRRTMHFMEATEESGPMFDTNVLAPNDAHTSARGTWGVEGERLTVRYQPEGASEETVERYDIVEVSPARVRLRLVAP